MDHSITSVNGIFIPANLASLSPERERPV
jgi:hypothetical protein